MVWYAGNERVPAAATKFTTQAERQTFSAFLELFVTLNLSAEHDVLTS